MPYGSNEVGSINATRVMVFIDGSNLYHGGLNFSEHHNTDFRIDYRKLLIHLVNDRTLVRVTYYCSVPENPTTGESAFLAHLRSCEIHVVEKRLKIVTDRQTGRTKAREKGVDVALATDLLGMGSENAYDVAILVSGDADYVGAVNRVMSKGKNVELVSFKDSCSTELSKSAAKTIFIDDIAQDIEL